MHSYELCHKWLKIAVQSTISSPLSIICNSSIIILLLLPNFA